MPTVSPIQWRVKAIAHSEGGIRDILKFLILGGSPASVLGWQKDDGSGGVKPAAKDE